MSASLLVYEFNENARTFNSFKLIFSYEFFSYSFCLFRIEKFDLTGEQ